MKDSIAFQIGANKYNCTSECHFWHFVLEFISVEFSNFLANEGSNGANKFKVNNDKKCTNVMLQAACCQLLI